MTDIRKEAIADANRVQAAAEERAKSMLLKEFTPKIKSALSSLINEEVSSGNDQPSGYNPEEDKDAVGATVPAGQNSEDMLDKGDGPEKIKEEEGLEVDDEEGDVVTEEDGVEDDEFNGEPVAEAEDEVPSQEDDEVLEIVDDEEPADTEEVPPSIEEEEEDQEDDGPEVYEALRRKNKKLSNENKELREAIQSLSNKFRKIDLFNAKLASAFKLLTRPGLTKVQKKQIAENFDNAKSVREVNLIYRTLKASLGAPNSSAKRVLENKNVKSVISESTQQKSSFNRMNELAGL